VIPPKKAARSKRKIAGDEVEATPPRMPSATPKMFQAKLKELVKAAIKEARTTEIMTNVTAVKALSLHFVYSAFTFALT
jgi:hypothetical protein